MPWSITPRRRRAQRPRRGAPRTLQISSGVTRSACARARSRSIAAAGCLRACAMRPLSGSGLGISGRRTRKRLSVRSRAPAGLGRVRVRRTQAHFDSIRGRNSYGCEIRFGAREVASRRLSSDRRTARRRRSAPRATCVRGARSRREHLHEPTPAGISTGRPEDTRKTIGERVGASETCATSLTVPVSICQQQLTASTTATEGTRAPTAGQKTGLNQRSSTSIEWFALISSWQCQTSAPCIRRRAQRSAIESFE